MPASGAGVAAGDPALPRGRVLCQSRTGPESDAGLILQGATDIVEMQQFLPRAPILEIAAQREFDARKGDLRPRNLGLLVESDLQALGADAEFALEQGGSERHVDLRGVQH